jgi:hypothetical protein
MVSPSRLWEINKGNPHEMNIYMMSKEIQKVKMCVTVEVVHSAVLSLPSFCFFLFASFCCCFFYRPSFFFFFPCSCRPECHVLYSISLQQGSCKPLTIYIYIYIHLLARVLPLFCKLFMNDNTYAGWRKKQGEEEWTI